ncbi:hypothetical protein [Haloferula sp.]|uniref:hypothetical protein n=1 Tax=Haloferula sp. TaxID=2497595 RepID=UPI00329D2390
MKFLIKLFIWFVVGITLYLVSYFVIMEEGIALNPRNHLPEYSSISRFASSDRNFGPLSLQVTYSTWLNPIFQPLDKLFRDDHPSPLKWESHD